MPTVTLQGVCGQHWHRDDAPLGRGMSHVCIRRNKHKGRHVCFCEVEDEGHR